MSKVQTLRVFVKQRLTAAAEEIFELFERTIAEYEEELGRQRKLLDAVLKPQVQLHRADVQELLGSKEAVPLEQASLDQEDPSELPHIKEEGEKLWTRQEGEEEADITKFTFGAERTESTAHIRVRRQFFWRKSSCESVKMSKVRTRRVFVKQRLTAAAEEIFELFERTIAEYEEELGRQRKLLDAVFQPRVQLHRTVQTVTPVPVKSEEDDEEEPQSSQLHQIKPEEIRDGEDLKTEADGEDCGGPEPDRLKMDVQFSTADVQQLLPIKEDVPPEQQERSSSLDQEDPPELPHIKEDQEELWTRQEGDQLQGLEEADIIKFTFSPVPVRSEEEDEEEPQSSQLHQIKPEEIRDVEQPESDDSWDWEDTRERRSGLDPLQHNKAPMRDVDCDPGATSGIPSKRATTSGHRKHRLAEIQRGMGPFGCSVCGKRYHWKKSLTLHMKRHTEKKPFSCSLCEITFTRRDSLVKHIKSHAGELPFTCPFCDKVVPSKIRFISHLSYHTAEKKFSCSVCGKRFGWKNSLASHLRLHSEERVLSCLLCDKTFKTRAGLLKHKKIHRGENRFNCSFCGKRFTKSGNLTRHLEVHKGERSITCSICKLSFVDDCSLSTHMSVHTGPNPYRCSFCKKTFQTKYILVKHMKLHTGEKPFSCPFCDKGFAETGDVKRHMRVHTGEESSSCTVCHKSIRHVEKHKCVGESIKNT